MKARKCPVHNDITCDCMYNQDHFQLTLVFDDVRKGYGESRERLMFIDQNGTDVAMLIEGLSKCISKGYIDLKETTATRLVLTGVFKWYRRTFIEPYQVPIA